jgi:Holliday junction DNA helicase RuvA
MIGLLKGYVTHKFDNNIILDVNGVGYEVFLPSSQLMNLPISIANMQTPVTLHIHTQVKEDSLELFGFTTLKDKQFFKILISISGVGPKLGLTILNTMEVSSLMDAIRMGNSKILTKIPGIGTKTAERLVLEILNQLKPPHQRLKVKIKRNLNQLKLLSLRPEPSFLMTP